MTKEGRRVANEKNLEKGKATQFRAGEEQAEVARQGGIASGVARRRKRALKEAAELYLSLPLRDGRKRNALLKDGIGPEDIDNQMAVIAGLTKMAQAGDARSAKLLFEILGELGTAGDDGGDGVTVKLEGDIETYAG